MSATSDMNVEEAITKSYAQEETDTVENVKKSSFSDQLERKMNVDNPKKPNSHKGVYENVETFLPDVDVKAGSSSHVTNLVSSYLKVSIIIIRYVLVAPDYNYVT